MLWFRHSQRLFPKDAQKVSIQNGASRQHFYVHNINKIEMKVITFDLPSFIKFDTIVVLTLNIQNTIIPSFEVSDILFKAFG